MPGAVHSVTFIHTCIYLVWGQQNRSIYCNRWTIIDSLAAAHCARCCTLSGMLMNSRLAVVRLCVGGIELKSVAGCVVIQAVALG